MKRAYDAGMLDRKRIDEYCMNGGEISGLALKPAFMLGTVAILYGRK